MYHTLYYISIHLQLMNSMHKNSTWQLTRLNRSALLITPITIMLCIWVAVQKDHAHLTKKNASQLT